VDKNLFSLEKPSLTQAFFSYNLTVRKMRSQEKNMLVKITSKNQITIPKKLADKLGGIKYLEANYQEGGIFLKPVQTYETDLDAIRSKMKKLGLGPESVQEAVAWARSKE
jgi:AbrB family looped-hinge helix DNA binding protein